MNALRLLPPLVLLLASCTSTTPASTTDGSVADSGSNPNSGVTDGAARQFTAEVWADNWFAMYLDDTLIQEDSVPITTERSFNSEVFTFETSYTLNLNLIVKDYKQDDTGLEYIGAANQQMGDGGLILQITDDQSGEVVAVSSRDWRCLVIHEAPLDKSCERDPNPSQTCTFSSMEEPEGWKQATFDTSGWQAATEYSEAEVGPKDGYDEITWSNDARLIWTSDLETHNTLLCKSVIAAP